MGDAYACAMALHAVMVPFDLTTIDSSLEMIIIMEQSLIREWLPVQTYLATQTCVAAAVLVNFEPDMEGNI